LDINQFKEAFPNNYFKDREIEFLRQSNYIESEYSDQALIDAMYAWLYMRNCGRFTVYNVLQTHYTLMKNLDFRIAGRIRNQEVYVGGCLRPFISEQLIRDDLEYLFGKMNRFEVSPKEAHITFERIHPFEDGNGRTGRIVYNLHRLLLEQPIHIIKESEKEDYYKWFE
jgi:Fic family protein